MASILSQRTDERSPVTVAHDVGLKTAMRIFELMVGDARITGWEIHVDGLDALVIHPTTRDVFGLLYVDPVDQPTTTVWPDTLSRRSGARA